ncbi:hypothetical protein FF36_02816 [Frankia torreyi]|uniref:Dolichyl-phosphate-mannose-protein mannosyltransferase n=1 Tax=Frankia torreyi TaxID=1856 RepID=A0A0D8BF02_9ACTN|nr:MULTISPECIES: hypothetical protein [Frankia]KJE22838.1 hypothetical protein FF36_02816 [Frankia torreyi]KQC40257.1 hypothetical protein UK82_01145 [Frankia sp. ACN1ag]
MDNSRRDLRVALLLAVAVIAVEITLHARIGRPLWYDELWRPHFAGEPWPTFWPELKSANAPSSLGSIALTRLTGNVLGWHAWTLRTVTAGIWLPVLAVATFLSARRFTGVLPAAGGAVAVALSGTVVDSGTQLKPYVLEAVVSLAVFALWTAPGAPLRNRTAAGALAAVSLPAVFLLVPLAVGDLVRDRRTGWRAAPALLLAGGHTLLFVSHQSSQRASHFWDDQFLAGRGVLGGLRFTADQALAVLGGAPPGIDRYDPNLVHSLLEGHRLATALVGTATAVAMLAGARALRRRTDGATLLWSLVGAELLQLAASGGRYWPFGACRPNLFLVPLLTIVAAVGAGELAAAACRRRGHVIRAASVLCLAGVAATPVCAAAGIGTMWRERHDVRPIEGMVDATLAVRDQYRPGDAVIVGGRLARAGWLYGMELSADGPRRPGARVPRSATTFLTAIGRGGAERAVRTRQHPPRRVLLFVLAYDRRGTAAELATLRRGGWCNRGVRSFPLTGTLHELDRCAVTGRRGPPSPSAGR